MGVLNVTPDSFSDGGNFATLVQAVAHALQMVADGADILDIGGESTRPGAAPVSEQQEIDRVVPVIEAIRSETDIPVSVDSSKPGVMRAAVAAGACLINDVRALQLPGALEAAVSLDVPVCLMHMQGEPDSMQDDPRYYDVVREVRDYLLARASACEAAGLSSNRILLDPGFGFGKTLAHNLSLLKHLDRLVECNYPVLVGMSRKSMIGQVLDLPVDERLHPSVALAVMAAWQGAKVIRVHDVKPTVQALRMCQAVMTAE